MANIFLHIHQQQIEHRNPKLWFEIIDSTKNEKGVSHDGRYVPVSKELINEIRAAKSKAGIDSEFLFANKNGEFVKKKVYSDAFTAVCEKLNLPKMGAYTFRREYNIKLEQGGMTATERAAIMGNSAEVNQNYYTFAQNQVSKARAIIESDSITKGTEKKLHQVTPQSSVFQKSKTMKKPLNSTFKG